jgi:integrase
MRIHVLPALGDILLVDVQAKHIADLVRKLRAAELAPRTVRNVYSVAAALFRDARIEGLIEQSPCILDDRHLGAIVDKDPEWRASAVFTRGEVERLISDERITLDRRVQYAIQFLAGLRFGEVVALRWRHLDAEQRPLGRLLVATSYNTHGRRIKGTKTEAVRHVPVHPVLAAVLAEWRLGGWAEMMGAPPGTDDLILPLAPEAKARRRRFHEDLRDHHYAYKLWKQDVAALGLRHRRGHDARATFITLALDDGADPRIIEERVTHTKRQRGAFDGYNRGRQWEATCAEVAKLRITRRVTERVTTHRFSSESVVRAGGLEPPRG